MFANRSIPRATVIPVLAYPDVNQAADWLCDVFGFSVRLRIGDHRVQLHVGEGAVIVRELRPHEDPGALGAGYSVMIRVEEVDAHWERVRERVPDKGGRVLQEPCTYPYGERQYSVEDFAGHVWGFSQSVADVQPEEWGGVAGQL